MVCVIYDIENDTILESDIRTWKAAERDVAKELIEKLELKGFKNDILLFDRGYPSKDMFDFLESKQLKYLMRVKVNKFHPEFDKANEPDQLITLIHKNKTLTLRIINVILPTGEVEKLVTNIMNVDFTTEDLNILIAKMTRTLIECFYEDDLEKRTILFDKAMENITKNLIPIRPNRSFPRREPSRKSKYPVNKKRSV